MNWFELWILKRILRKTVKQGNQKEKVTGFYRLVMSAAMDEYTEDNKVTIRAFLEECHNCAADKM